MMRIMSVWLLCFASVVARAADPAWTPEVTLVLRVIAEGRFAEAEKLAQRLAREADSDEVRGDASALAAVAMMCTGGRDNARTGRALLRELAVDTPDLLERPLCQWALGISQREEYDTARALFRFYQALEGFRRCHDTQWEGRTLVELARTWVRHNDWESPIPNHPVQPPVNSAEADELRRREVDRLRKQAAKLDATDRYGREIDLILADYLLDRGERESAAGLLRRAAAVDDDVSARAVLRLAELAEEAGRRDEADQLYRRVVDLGIAPWSGQARRRIVEMASPQLQVDLAPAPGGSPLRLSIRVRNVHRVVAELRRLDLRAWVEERRGRCEEAALPVSGSLVASCEVEVPVEARGGWWSPPEEWSELRTPTPAGVLLVRACAGQREVTVKRLVVPADLTAGVLVGARRAAVWALETAGGSAAAPAAGSAWFWMAGAFVPRRLTLENGVAVFDLPPEAWVMRSRRWVCLVECGQRVALCRGLLGEESVAPRPAVVMTWGPEEAHPGGTVKAVGWLLGPEAGAISSLQLRMVDTVEQTHRERQVTLGYGRTFEAGFDVTSDMMQSYYRIQAAEDGRRLAALTPVGATHVTRIANHALLDCDMAAWIPSQTTPLTGTLRGAYAWGAPLSRAEGACSWQGRWLPVPGEKAQRVYSGTISELLRLDDEGRYSFLRLPTDFNLGEGPLAARVQFTVRRPDGRLLVRHAFTQWGGERPHLWIDSSAEARLGEPLELHVGWYDPGHLAGGALPRVEVRYADGPREALPMVYRSGGLSCDTWRPHRLGNCEVVATVDLPDGSQRTVRQPLTIVPGKGAWGAVEVRGLTARRRGALVRVAASVESRPGPLLFVLHSDGQLLDAAVADADRAAVALDGGGAVHGRLRVLVVGLDAQGGHALTQTDVVDEVRPELAIQVLGPVMPGARCRLRLENRGDRPVRLLWRLADRSLQDGIDWDRERGQKAFAAGWGLVMHSSAAEPVRHAVDLQTRTVPETSGLPADLQSVFRSGRGLSVGSIEVPSHGTSVLELRLPSEPGLWWLGGLVVDDSGRWSTHQIALGPRRGLSGRLCLSPRLLPGDRPVVVGRIENRSDTDARVRIRFDPGGGMVCARLRFDDQTRRADEPLEVVVPAGGCATVQADCEATAPGRRQAALVVTGAAAQRFATAYEVGPEPPVDQAAAEAVRIERTVWRLEPITGATDTEKWRRVRLAPGEPVAPGTLLLVQERIAASGPWRDVEWLQEAAGNCHTRLGQPGALSQFGRPVRTRVSALKYRAVALRSGTHEYTLAAVLPGVCRLPPPVVYSEGRRVPVVVVPAETLVSVVRP